VEESVIPANEVSLLTVRREMTVPGVGGGPGAAYSILLFANCQQGRDPLKWKLTNRIKQIRYCREDISSWLV
jgi:hypothetical protein